MDTWKRMPWQAQKAAFEKLMERAEVANFTPEERAQYEAQLDAYRVMTSAMEKSKLDGKEEGKQEGFRQGKQAGLQEGKRKGLQEGLEKGVLKGKQEGLREGERKKACEIASALKRRGLDTASIAEISGLTEEEIERLE